MKLFCIFVYQRNTINRRSTRDCSGREKWLFLRTCILVMMVFELSFCFPFIHISLGLVNAIRSYQVVICNNQNNLEKSLLAEAVPAASSFLITETTARFFFFNSKRAEFQGQHLTVMNLPCLPVLFSNNIQRLGEIKTAALIYHLLLLICFFSVSVSLYF